MHFIHSSSNPNILYIEVQDELSASAVLDAFKGISNIVSRHRNRHIGLRGNTMLSLNEDGFGFEFETTSSELMQFFREYAQHKKVEAVKDYLANEDVKNKN